MKSKILLSCACIALATAALLSGCSGQSNEAITAAATDIAKTTAQSIFKTVTHEYVTAKLESNELTLTFSLGEDGEFKNYLSESIECGKPYPVSGLSNNYIDIYVGTMGQDICPFVFLLTDRKTVECVPVPDQLYYTQDFASIGELTGVTDVVSLRDGTVTDESGGYVNIYAVKSDGSEYDLSDVWYRMNNDPEDIIPTNQDAMDTLSSEQSVKKLLNKGMKMLATDETECIFGEMCALIAIGTDHEENFVRESYYAVSSTGAIYLFDVVDDKWVPVNMLAETYSADWNESKYLAVFSDSNTDGYDYYNRQKSITEISTPAASPYGANRVLVVPMKTGMSMRIETLNVDEKGDISVDSVVKTIEKTTRGEVYAISVTISETIPTLRIVAEDEYSFCEWYAVYDGENGNGIAYIYAAAG